MPIAGRGALNRWNLMVLGVVNALNRANPSVVILTGGLVGLAIAPNPILATLPATTMVLGLWFTSYPAAAIMRRIGRRGGFALGSLVSALASVGAVTAIAVESFTGFCLSTLLLGANQAFVQQYRFAAAENIEPSRVGSAISLILLTSIVAAFVGPELGKSGRDWIEGAPFAGGFLAGGVLNLIAFLLLLTYRGQGVEEEPDAVPERPLRIIAAQPAYRVAAAAGGISFAVMSLLMTAAPISMRAMHGLDLEVTALAIQSHIIAMYLPSIVTGSLIKRFGTYRVMTAGVLTFLACIAVAWTGYGALQFWLTLVLLGIGWNFLFTAGTTLLTTTYRASERYQAQGLNELLVFGTMAIVTLASGAILQLAGWRVLTISILPLLVAMQLLIMYSSRIERSAQSPGRD